MTVYKKVGGTIWHYDFVFEGQRYCRSTKTTSKRKARSIEIAHKKAVALEAARVAHGLPPLIVPAKTPTLDEAADEWWIAKGQYLGSNDKAKAFNLTRLKMAVATVGGDKRVTELRNKDIAEAVAKRAATPVKSGKGVRQRKAGTVNRDIIETIRPVVYRACTLLDVGPPPIKWGEHRMKTAKPYPRKIAEDRLEAFIADSGLIPPPIPI